ncbi:MAG: OmpH family outer membrane protein [Crocinitomicaceae bacterium]
MKKYFIILFTFFAISSLNAQSKIAHLNSQKVMEAMPSYQKAVEALEAFGTELDAELNEMIQDYQNAITIFQEKKDGLPPIRIQFEQEKIAKKEQAIQERQQTMQTEIQAYSRELNAPILYAVETAVSTISEENGYEYVFDETMLLISNGTDITKEVIEEALKLDGKPTPPPLPQVEIKEVETRP